MADGEGEFMDGGVRKPPYVAFQTVLTFIEDLKTNTVPPRIDRSVLMRFSGTVGAHLLMALKFLGLTDNDGSVQPALRSLVAAHGTDEFRDRLRAVIEASYPWLAELDLRTATPSMFAEVFRSNVAAKEDVLEKCRRFYLHAAKHAGIEIGPRLLARAGRVRQNGTSVRRRGKAPGPKSEEPPSPPQGKAGVENDGSDGEMTLAAKLIDKFPAFDPQWPDEIKAQWFKGFGEFMAMTKK